MSVNTTLFFNTLLNKFTVEKTLESYPESSDRCDHKSGYIKHDFKLHTTKDGTLKTEKTLARNLRKLKTRKIVRSLKLFRVICHNKKVSKNTKISKGMLYINSMLYIIFKSTFFNF